MRVDAPSELLEEIGAMDPSAVLHDTLTRRAGLLGMHQYPATVPPEIAKALSCGEPAPAGLSPEEKAAYGQMDALYKKGSGYPVMMVNRPQTLGYSLADSRVGLAAWFYDKFADWTYTGGQPEKELTRDEMFEDITLCWLAPPMALRSFFCTAGPTTSRKL